MEQSGISPVVAVLMTGNELMTGDIVDSNSARLAEWLLELGLTIRTKVTVGDSLTQLVEEIRRLSSEYQLLIVNGGLGPTRDDLTAEALAGAMGTDLAEHPEALAHLENWCKRRGFELNSANRKQAMLPVGVNVVANDIGSAVGFHTRLNGCDIYCTPGVPSEFQRMMQQYICPALTGDHTHAPYYFRRRLRVFGMGEASLQQAIEDQPRAWPESVELGFRASLPMLEIKLQIDRESALSALSDCESNLRQLFGDHIVTDDERTIAQVLVDLLREQVKTMTCAESCTGGLIASEVTAVAGASAAFEAGFVTYSNAIKERVLGVSGEVLAQHGAVSEAVVRAMLQGALNVSGADLGVAVSGIAGPSGGSDDKPVGLVWVAWGTHSDIHAREFFFPGSRQRFQTLVAALGMDLLRRELIQSQEEPVYFRERVRKHPLTQSNN